ncbi:SUR7 family protein pun1 [Neolecta irregularis DAH-3]|uniref:SUR7 family protein pun1 n=1 Tax=Neolecta irregularis (strain DAH-3) TaxID=1198029 RepID=A0A1U7LI72_NEOID|nr:SUR7 family protein pun1 [Neolecta irregularis DAH-3]|eukprot:OLL22360.1 SUR7 family protein pun1 [Neolecta irregularis DAH-3]
MVSVVRTVFTLLPLVMSVLATICLVFVMVGDTKPSNPSHNIYFLRVNTTNIVATKAPASVSVSTIARSIGLHDFYTVGLWGYCQGDLISNTITCSDPHAFYNFNPIDIFQQQVLKGYTITVPSSVQQDIENVRVASRWMFACYFVAVVATGTTALIGMAALVSRIASLFAVLTALLATCFTVVASAIAQVMFIIIRNAFNNQIQLLNVPSTLGHSIFALTWVAAAANLLAFIGFAISGCCTNGRTKKNSDFR